MKRGYDEQMIHRMAMEVDFCLRLHQHCGLGNLSLQTTPTADFYHQPHERCADRAENVECDLDDLWKALKEGAPTFTNDESWGLQNAQQEIVEKILGKER